MSEASNTPIYPGQQDPAFKANNSDWVGDVLGMDYIKTRQTNKQTNNAIPRETAKMLAPGHVLRNWSLKELYVSCPTFLPQCLATL